MTELVVHLPDWLVHDGQIEVPTSGSTVELPILVRAFAIAGRGETLVGGTSDMGQEPTSHG